MIVLGVVVLPEKTSVSSMENSTFVQLVRNVLHQKNQELGNKIQVSTTLKLDLIDKIGMPIYIVNLNRSIDRWKNIIYDIESIYPVPSVNRIEAVDGAQMISKTEGELNGVKYKNSMDGCSKSELACTLSHLKSIKLAYDNNLPYVLIVEDDAMFGLYAYWKKSILNILEDLQKLDSKWHMLLLFSTSINYKNEEHEFIKTSDYCGTVAYVMNREGMQTVMDKVYDPVTNTFVLDSSIAGNAVADKFIYTACGNTYTYFRPLIYTTDTDSTIAGEQRRNNANFWSAKILKEYLKDIAAHPNVF